MNVRGSPSIGGSPQALNEDLLRIYKKDGAVPIELNPYFIASNQAEAAPLPGMRLKSWREGAIKIDLFYDWGEIKARIIKNGEPRFIGQRCINGIPSNLSQTPPEELVKFFTDKKVTLMSSKKESARLDVVKSGLHPKVLGMMREAIEHAKAATGREVVVFIGNTGTGKSTLINQLLGLQMYKVQRGDEFEKAGLLKGRIVVKPPDVEVAKIGHHSSRSETFFAQIYPTEEFTFADAGGFFDTRGNEADIAVSTSLKLTLHNARNVKLVLCFSHGTFEADKMIHLTQSARHILGAFFEDYSQHSESILLMITCLLNSDFDAIDACEVLQRASEEADVGDLRKGWMKFLSRENGKYICVSNPLSSDSRAEILQKLRDMTPITDPSNNIKVISSEGSRLPLLEEMTEIASNGYGLYMKAHSTAQTIEEFCSELKNLREKEEAIQKTISELELADNPDAIEGLVRKTIEENERIIAIEQGKLENIEKSVSNLATGIEAVNEKIAYLNERGKEQVVVWDQHIFQEGRTTQEITTDKVTRMFKFLGFIPLGTKVETINKVTVHKHTIAKDFEYKGLEGLEITRHTKDPASGPCWRDEKGGVGKNFYSIHYETEEGEPAAAAVKIEALYSGTHAFFTEKNGFLEEINSLRGKISKYDTDKERCIQEIKRAQAIINDINDKMRRKEILEASMTELENSAGTVLNLLLKAQNKEHQIRKSIVEKQPLFQFLMEYLALSTDEDLAKNLTIKRFLTVYDNIALDQNLTENPKVRQFFNHHFNIAL